MESSSEPSPESMEDPIQNLPLLKNEASSSVFNKYNLLDDPMKESLLNATIHLLLAHSSSKEVFAMTDLKNHLCVTHPHLKDDIGKYTTALLCEAQEVLRDIFGLDVVCTDSDWIRSSTSTRPLLGHHTLIKSKAILIVNRLKHDLLLSLQSDEMQEEIAVIFILLQIVYCSHSSSTLPDATIQPYSHAIEVAKLQEALESYMPLPHWLMNDNQLDVVTFLSCLEKWKKAGYFSLKDGIVGIGIRSVVEFGFRKFIRSHFMEDETTVGRRMESTYVIDMIENREQKAEEEEDT